MNLEFLWWNQIRCGNKLMDHVVHELSEENSIIISNVSCLPWKNAFYYLLETKLSSGLNVFRSFSFLSHEKNKKPGKMILDNYCCDRIKSNYWLNTPYSKYLAKNGDSLLCQRYIIVQNISSEQDFLEWTKFISEYKDECDRLNKNENRAIFIIESPDRINTSSLSKIKVLNYDQQEIDLFSFCVINTPQNISYHLSRYLAELITISSKKNAEVAEKLLLRSLDLLKYPQNCIQSIYNEFGIEYNTETVEKANYLAQLKYIFPLLELHKRTIIEKYYKEISALLPWKDDHNNLKESAFDLELRDILFLSSKIGLNKDEKEEVSFLKEARNTLAHNKTLFSEQIISICNTFASA